MQLRRHLPATAPEYASIAQPTLCRRAPTAPSSDDILRHVFIPTPVLGRLKARPCPPRAGPAHRRQAMQDKIVRSSNYSLPNKSRLRMTDKWSDVTFKSANHRTKTRREPGPKPPKFIILVLLPFTQYFPTYTCFRHTLSYGGHTYCH